MNAAYTYTITLSKTAKAAILAGAGEVGRACNAAFTYELETYPEAAAKFLKEMHDTVPSLSHHPSYIVFKPAKNLIPLNAVLGAFSEMPKQSASHRDGWTWELLRDPDSRPSIMALLR